MTTIALPVLTRPRPAVILAWVVGGLGGLFLLLAAGVFPQSTGYGFDLDCYVGGAARLVAGDELYLGRLVAAPFRHGGPDVYVYPPPFAIALIPFAGLPFDGLAFGWLILRVGLLLATCALLPLPAHQRAAAFGIMAFSLATLIDLNLGNVSLVVLFLVVLAWRLREQGAGGVALALATALRPTTGVLLVWALVGRHKRVLIGACAAGLAIFLLTLPFVGIDGWLDYSRVLRNVEVGGHPRNGALESVAISLGLAAPVPMLLHLAGVGLAVGAVAAATRRRDDELLFVVTLMAGNLVTPLLWEHYLVTLLVPAAFLARRGRTWALALPLLGWLPFAALAGAAIGGLLLPLLAPPEARPGLLDGRDDGLEPQPVPDAGLAPLESPGR